MVGDHKMVDEGGHNGPNPIPRPPADDLMESVHHFYDEYYFAPKRRSESYTSRLDQRRPQAPLP